jgi:hypothetical protein
MIWIDLPTEWVLLAMANQKSLTHYEAATAITIYLLVR